MASGLFPFLFRRKVHEFVGIPGPKPKFPFGTALDFARGGQPWEVCARYAEQYGPVTLIWLMGQPAHGRATVGTRLLLGDPDGQEPWVTVVGVVPDLWDRPLDPSREAGVYLPLSQSGMGDGGVRLGRLGLYYQTVIVRARTGAAGVPAVVRDQIYQLDGSLPVRELSTMEAVVAQRMGRFRIWGRFYVAFALAGLLLASVGVYGVLTFGVAQRTSEIGVRRALGATKFSVQRQILGRAGTQIAIGTTVGLLVGWLLSDGMARVLYGVNTTDPFVFASVGGLMALVGLLASWLPARRAAAIDPVEAIRCD